MIDFKKAHEVYENIKGNFKGREGEIVAIDLDSGDYFIGKNIMDAYDKAIKKHPKKQFYFVRVGKKYVYTVGAYPR